MKQIWFGLIIEIIILSIMRPLVADFESVGIISVLLHVTYVMIILISSRHKFKIIFLGAFFARVFFLFWDLYARHIYILPNSGDDSEMYYRYAVKVSENLTLLSQNIHGGIYSKIVGVIYYFIGPQRIFGQYINVLLGLSVVFIVYKILKMIEVNSHTTRVILLLTSFFPNSLVMSAIFLREIFPAFFVVSSLYYFIKWFQTNKLRFMFLSYFMLGIGAMFHSGIVGIAAGFAFGNLFYKKDKNAFRFSSGTIVSFAIILFIGVISFTTFNDLIFSKFGRIEDINTIYATANTRYGGSAYLTGIVINNPKQLILYGPIKTFYFYTAPLPIDWRGLMDIFSFITDSMLYMITILYFIKNRKKFNNSKPLIIIFVIMIIGAGIIFGIGVSNAGTAIRHRQKLVSVFLILLGLMVDKKRDTALV